MKKKNLKFVLIFFIVVISLYANGQGIKGVEIGDYGLTSPMWGRSEIETTIFGMKGELSIKKHDSKIYSITFEAIYFDKCDELAQSLKKKYNLKTLEKGITGKWFSSEDDNISIYISNADERDNGMRGWKGLVLDICDKNVCKKAVDSKKNKYNDDF